MKMPPKPVAHSLTLYDKYQLFQKKVHVAGCHLDLGTTT